MRFLPFLEFSNPPRKIAAVFTYTAVAVLSGLGLVGKADLLKFALHTSGTGGLLIGAVLVPFLWPIAIRFRSILLLTILFGFFGTILFVYPRVIKLHYIGRGSDQADCVIVAGDQLLKGHWPYQRSLLWSHNPMSCGPGWVALQAPAIKAFGYRATIILIWICSLSSLVKFLRWQGLIELISILFLSSGVWLALANGSDFLSFGICIAALALACEENEKKSIPLIILTILIVQFRFPIVVLPIFMRIGKSRFLGVFITLIATACFIAFFIWKPYPMIDDGPLFLIHKMTTFQSPTRNTTGVLLAFAALFAGCIVIFSRVSRRLSSLWQVLLCMLIIFGVPAILNLVLKIINARHTITALGSWEGGMWLVACLPLACVLVVRERHAALCRRL